MLSVLDPSLIGRVFFNLETMKEGDICTHCHTQEVEKTTENKDTVREQTYLICPNCCSTYIIEE